MRVAECAHGAGTADICPKAIEGRVDNFIALKVGISHSGGCGSTSRPCSHTTRYAALA